MSEARDVRNEAEVPPDLQRALESADLLLDLDPFEQALKAEFEGMEPGLAELSVRLRDGVSAETGDECFLWSRSGWTRASEAGASRPADCVRGLVEDLVEEERIGAWRCSREPSRPAALELRTSLRSRSGLQQAGSLQQQTGSPQQQAGLETGCGELRLRLEAREAGARLFVRQPDKAQVSGLRLRQRGTSQRPVQHAGSEGELCFELQQLDELELEVDYADAGVQRTRLPVRGRVGVG